MVMIYQLINIKNRVHSCGISTNRRDSGRYTQARGGNCSGNGRIGEIVERVNSD